MSRRPCTWACDRPVDTPPVVAGIDLTLIANTCHPAAGPIVLRGVLTYIAEDPYAVALAIHSPDGHDVVEWHLSRDMLAEGLRHPVGVGDVRLRPADQLVEIILSSPCGTATLTTPRPVVAAFVHTSYAFLPRGVEYRWLNVDLEATLTAILCLGGSDAW
jgi:hypothetical protein